MTRKDMTEDAGKVTQQLAAHVAGLDYDNIPPQTRETAKRFLLDGIGCLLAGTRGGPGAMAWRATSHLTTGFGPSTIMISGARASARDAAFVNGITLYSVGVNDIHKPSGAHPGGCVVPALLAVGEWQKSGGRDMLAAMIAGYDVMGRLGRAMIPSHRDRGFHPTGTFGTFASTAAVGRLFGLAPATMETAFGIAGSQAAGLKAFQTDGSLTMIFHAGRAAQNGVEAVMLAREGFTGPRTVFEDKHGFVAATADEYRMSAITQALGSEFEVDATTFRPFYGCTLTITASGCTAAIMKRNLQRRAEDVTAISVRCNPAVVEEVGNPDPQTLLAARLSLPFNVALVVINGDVLVGDVTEEDLRAPRLRRLMPLVEFKIDESMPRYGSDLTVHFRDGGSDRAEILSPKGDPDNPLDWDDIETKFLSLVAPLGNAVLAREIVKLVRNIEATDGTTLMKSVNALARAGAQP